MKALMSQRFFYTLHDDHKCFEMKRRRAIQNIVVVGSGLVLLPACDFEPIPVFGNIPLEKRQYRFLQELSEAILPVQKLAIAGPDTPVDLGLTLLNDCYAAEDRAKFLAGLTTFQKHLKEQYGKSLAKLDSEQKKQLFEFIAGEENTDEALKYFFNTMKRFTVQHFTGTEHFMTQYLEFEFAPGRYVGCVRV